MLPKELRLKKRSAFNATYKTGKSFHNDGITMFCGRKNEMRHPTKAGFVVSKKIDKRAVIRNKIKRRMRESFKIYLKEKEIPYLSLIMSAKENAKNADFQITLKSVYKLMDKMANKFIQEYY